MSSGKVTKAGLPVAIVNSFYIFTKEDGYLCYPNNYNHFVNYYPDRFQHGGVGLEEMITPIVGQCKPSCIHYICDTMDYQKFQPCAVLQPYVECYFDWHSVSGPVQDMQIESPPNGFCSMVFNYADPYFVQTKKYERLPVPMQFVSGQNIYSYKLILAGNIGIAGIVFKPAALATLFGLPVYEYVEERVDLYALFHKATIDRMVASMALATTVKERIHHLEAFILHQYHLRPPEPDFIDQAANFIVEHNGMLQVNDLLKDSYMSRRTFERHFFQKVGLSPKYYARIRRIAYLCNLIAGKKKVDWAKIFYECQFYDQAHFIKDFLEFTGRTPQQYLKENNELANFLEKPSTQSLQ